jgi:hypothetical protein
MDQRATVLPPKRKSLSALRHGAYARTVLLPGEDLAALERLHESLIVEFAPHGALERHTVATLTRLVWRRQHLEIYRRAELAREKVDEIDSKVRAEIYQHEPDEAACELKKAVEAKAREELGDRYALIAAGEATTIDFMRDELAVEDYLDVRIDRCVKRLIQLKAFKSMLKPARPQITGPDREPAGT